MWWTFFQRMECQCTPGSEAAPASATACVISASPPEVGWPGSLVREDLREVSPLSREGMSSVGTHLLSARLLGGVGLLPDPIPAVSWAALASRCPRFLGRRRGRQRGCHVAPMYPSGGRSRLDAGGPSSALAQFGASRPGHVPFWPKRNSSLRLFRVTTLTTLHIC